MHAVTLGQWGEGRGGAGVLGDDARVLEKGKSVGGRDEVFFQPLEAPPTLLRARRGDSHSLGETRARAVARDSRRN